MANKEGSPQDHGKDHNEVTEVSSQHEPQVTHVTVHGRRVTLADFSIPAINDGRPADVDGTLAAVRSAEQRFNANKGNKKLRKRRR